MKNLSIKSVIIILIFNFQLCLAQNFVDDLYFNDSEVDYSFLYSNNIEINENTEESNSSEYLDEYTNDDISYEYRIKRFSDRYDLDYYWDWDPYFNYSWYQPYLNYGYNSGLHWGYNWHQPYYGYNLGIHLGYSWNRPYNTGWHWGYNWHQPYFAYGSYYNHGWNYYGGHHNGHHHHQWNHHYMNHNNMHVDYGTRNQNPTTIQNTNINQSTSKYKKTK